MRWRRVLPFLPFWLAVAAVCTWAVWTSPQSRVPALAPVPTPSRALATTPVPFKLGPLEGRALKCEETYYLSWPVIGTDHARVIMPWLTPTPAREGPIELPLIEKGR